MTAISAPLTARQTLMWLDDRLFEDARYHNTVLLIRLDGPLDRARLSAAWTQTIADVDALRLRVRSDEPVQCYVTAPGSLRVVHVDEAEVTAWVAEACARRLDGDGPSWDAALLTCGPDRNVFYLCMNHALTDFTSMRLLASRFADRYSGARAVAAPAFLDYVQHEADYRASSAASRDLDYWTRKLAGGTPALRPYGIVRTERSVGIDRVACAPCSGEWSRRFSAMAGADPFVTASVAASRVAVLATAWSAYLHRVTGNREIVVGFPIANRSSAFRHTCGLFMEQGFLRVTIEPGETFATLGAKLRDDLWETLRHGAHCVSDRDLEFATLNISPPVVHPSFAGLQASVRVLPAIAIGYRTHAGQGDLRNTLGLRGYDGSGAPLVLELDFHRATWGPEQRRRVEAHLIRTLDALLLDANTHVDDVDLLDAGERWSALQHACGPEPQGATPDLLSVFANQTSSNPDHVAVIGPDATLTYGELDRRCERLALRLRALGVGAESRVAVAMPRGAGEVVALLATLRAGGGYVPVDPSHPVERIRTILEDAAPQVLVAAAGSPIIKALPAAIPTLDPDEVNDATPEVPSARPPPDGDEVGGRLAYILFTSGSTGRPKGVEVTRRALSNFLRSMATRPGLASQERLLAITTTTFDIAALELFLPLYVGAVVHIADRDTAVDPLRLREVLEKEPVTVMQATPATWRLLVDAGWRGGAKLRMLCGGEPLSMELADQLLARGAELWNLYGPTETTVWSSVERVAPVRTQITIGRPIDRTSIHVLDGRRRLVPRGVVGEIYIGGDGVARGYRGRPDLTAERFVADPFSRGTRLYRTGDLGRVLEDGRIECLGRADHQVKIRGFRVELGEVESALRRAVGVQEAVVVAQDQGRPEARLVAYWVGPAAREALHEAARTKLPSYMVPSAYVQLARFPLTTTGKIDRKALPVPDASLRSIRGGRRARHDLETRMCVLWSEVLGVAEVGIDDDFFALGGTSIMVIQARARIERELGIALPLRALFEAPTVATLVERFRIDLGRSSDPVIVPLRRGQPGRPPLFLLFGVQLYQDLARGFTEGQPVIAMHVPFPHVPGRDPLPRVETVAARYVNEIRRVQPHGPYRLGGLCFGGVVAFEAGRQLQAAGEPVSLVAVLDGRLPRTLDPVRRIWSRTAAIVRHPLAAASQLLWIGRRANGGSAPGAAASGPAVLPGDDLPVAGPLVRAELAAYRHRLTPIGADLVVIRACAPDGAFALGERDLGWRGLARSVAAYDIEAGHLDILHDPHAKRIAEILVPHLASASPADSATPPNRAGRLVTS